LQREEKLSMLQYIKDGKRKAKGKKEEKKKLYHFRVVSNAVIDSYSFPHHANIFL
jgi:hypothetical protein